MRTAGPHRLLSPAFMDEDDSRRPGRRAPHKPSRGRCHEDRVRDRSRSTAFAKDVAQEPLRKMPASQPNVPVVPQKAFKVSPDGLGGLGLGLRACARARSTARTRPL